MVWGVPIAAEVDRRIPVEQVDAELSGALARLLVSVERYPDLKASASFRDLQAQLEGTENRIAVARNRWVVDLRIMTVRAAVLRGGIDQSPQRQVDGPPRSRDRARRPGA